MSYVTVFEITHDPSLWWWPLLVLPVTFGLIGAVIFLLTRDLGFTTKVVRFFMFLFAYLAVTLLFYRYHKRRQYVRAYQNREYALVEGRVEHYSWKGKTECFTVRAIEFCRGTGNPEQLAWPIGLTRDGLPVRIAYSEIDHFPKVLRLEVGSSP